MLTRSLLRAVKTNRSIYVLVFQAPISPQPNHQEQSLRVLVVEDYAPIRESVVQGLQEADFAVDSVGNVR